MLGVCVSVCSVNQCEWIYIYRLGERCGCSKHWMGDVCVYICVCISIHVYLYVIYIYIIHTYVYAIYIFICNIGCEVCV